MSSPSGRSEATRSQDSMHASSQQGADVAIEDTALSVGTAGIGSNNVACTFAKRYLCEGRGRGTRTFRVTASATAGLATRIVGSCNVVRDWQSSLLRLLCQVWAVSQRKCSAFRQWWDATTAEAQSVRTQVESRIATLAAAAETGTARVAAELGSQIQKVAEYTDAQMSRVAADVSQATGKGD